MTFVSPAPAVTSNFEPVRASRLILQDDAIFFTCKPEISLAF